MPPTRKTQQSMSPNGHPVICMTYNGRKMRVIRPAKYEELEPTARRIFKLCSTHDLILSVAIPSIDDEEMEIDRAMWHEVKDHITVISVAIAPENATGTLKSEDNEVVVLATSQTRSAKISFSVVFSNGEGLSLSASPTIKWEKVYDALVRRFPRKCGSSFRICFDGRYMSRDKTIMESGVENDDIVDLAVEQVGGKPVIYLFSPTPVDARVSLGLVPEWSFSAIYPVTGIKESNNSGEEIVWDVAVRTDGTMRDKGTGVEVSYLYWEATSNPTSKQLASPATSRPSSPSLDEVFDPATPHIDSNNIVLLSIENVPVYLDKVLLALGLHTEARTSFITYWLPDMLKDKYIALRFLPQAVYEKAAPLNVSPTPSSIVRIFMLWKGLSQEDVDAGIWETARQRKSAMTVDEWREIVGLDTMTTREDDGLRVLEWGGMEVKQL